MRVLARFLDGKRVPQSDGLVEATPPASSGSVPHLTQSPFRGCRHSSPSYGRAEVTSVALVKISASIVTLRLAETFTISRRSENEADVVQVEVRHGDVSGFGEAAPIEHYAETAASASAWLDQVELGDDPFALDELAARLPPGEQAARSALDRRSMTCRASSRPACVQGARTAPLRAADLVDDLARRPRRHGATHREDRLARVPAAEAETRWPRRARRRARACGSRRHQPAAAVRRQRSVVARRGARVPAADSISSTASSRCLPATRTGRS